MMVAMAMTMMPSIVCDVGMGEETASIIEEMRSQKSRSTAEPYPITTRRKQDHDNVGCLANLALRDFLIELRQRISIPIVRQRKTYEGHRRCQTKGQADDVRRLIQTAIPRHPVSRCNQGTEAANVQLFAQPLSC